MFQFTVLLLLAFLIVTAFYAVFSASIINSIISLTIFSINVALLFVVLQAPDVAMTEAVIGAGLVTVMFVVTVNKIEGL